MISLWPWRQLAVVVLVLAPLAVVVRDAVALIGPVHHETEGVIFARVRIALLKLNLAIVTGETCMGWAKSLKVGEM